MLNENITLKKLHIFLVFMKYRTMSKTAETLNVSTVSIHRAIHSLEIELQCLLFQQKGRLLSPLPSAKVLENQVKLILQQLDKAIVDTQEASGLFSTQFKMGSLFSLNFNIIPKLIAGLKMNDKKLEVELTTSSNKSLFKKLKSFDLDVIVVSLNEEPFDPELTFLHLFDDYLAVAVSVNDPISTHKEISLDEIKNHPFVMLNKEFATANDVLKIFKNGGLKPNVVMEVNDIFSVVSMINAGIGCSLLPLRMAPILDANVKLIPLRDSAKVKQAITMVCLTNRSKEPKILTFINQCHSYEKSPQS